MSNTCLYSISKQHQKNTAQMRHSCTISPLHPPGEPFPARERREKYGANAPQLHHILAGSVVVVRAREVEWSGGDPCGRPGVCPLLLLIIADLLTWLAGTLRWPFICYLPINHSLHVRKP